jgi:hypothetical protein
VGNFVAAERGRVTTHCTWAEILHSRNVAGIANRSTTQVVIMESYAAGLANGEYIIAGASRQATMTQSRITHDIASVQCSMATRYQGNSLELCFAE